MFPIIFWLIVITAGALSLLAGLTIQLREDRPVAPPRSHHPDLFETSASR